MNPQLESLIREELRFDMPVHLEGWCTAEKGLALANLVLTRRPPLIVESGVFGGRSLIALAAACREVQQGVCYGIDPWTLDAAIEGGIGQANEDWWRHNVNLESIYEGFVRSVLRLELSFYCRWIRAKSETAAGMFQDGTIGLLHQDSNHSELVSCKEVETWHKKISPHGLWILDDADWDTQQKAIRQIHDHGFDVLRREKSWIVFERR